MLYSGTCSFGIKNVFCLQAYCDEGQWLTILKDKGPICDTRICPEPQPEDPGTEFVLLKDGRCVELGKFDNVTCNKSDVIAFHKRRIFPACRPLGISTGSVGIPSTDCPDGYFSTGMLVVS